MAERQNMSKLRGLSRRINKGKNKVKLKIEKQVKVKNGYLNITFPLTTEQFKMLDLFTDFMMSFASGDRSMDKPEDAEEWAVKVKQYIDALFGVNAYFKCFGDAVATHKEIGELFEQFNNLIRECKEEVKQLKGLISDCEKKMKK